MTTRALVTDSGCEGDDLGLGNFELGSHFGHFMESVGGIELSVKQFKLLQLQLCA